MADQGEKVTWKEAEIAMVLEQAQEYQGSYQKLEEAGRVSFLASLERVALLALNFYPPKL